MKRRYWISASVALVLGVFVWRCVYAFEFTGLCLCGLAVVCLVFGAVDLLRRSHPRAGKHLSRVLWVCVTLALAVTGLTAVWIGVYAKGSDAPEADYLIVLGAGVNGTQPSQALYERLCAARDYLNAYPDAVAILSGGQGANEDISEAECMHRWLTAAGISERRLRKEDRATSTEENLAFSLALIEEETGQRPEKIAVVSNEYHLLRAALWARSLPVSSETPIETLGVPARTRDRIYFCQMLLRETCGVWYALLLS